MDIITYEDANYVTQKKMIADLRKEIEKNWVQKEKTLVFVYYAGHGVMKDKLHTVCNPEQPYNPNPDSTYKKDPNRPIYSLENSLRNTLGQQNGGYTVGIFDCCREEYSSLSRGGADPPDDIDCDEKDYQNFILWVGCPPRSPFGAQTTI